MGYFDEAIQARDESESLEHHGILGQKWGVRRFESASGHLTPAGQARYNTVEGKYQKLKSAKAAKRSASWEYNKDFAKAYNASQRLNITRKRQADRDAKIEKAYKSGEKYDKSIQDYKKAKIDLKYAKKVAKNDTERDSMLEKRAQNREKLEKKMMKAQEKGNLKKSEHMKTKLKDFDEGTKAVKAGYDRYSKTLKDYGNAKISTIGNKEAKKSDAYKAATKAYRKQVGSDLMYGKAVTKLGYAGDAARKSINAEKKPSMKKGQSEKSVLKDLERSSNNMSEEEKELLRELMGR